MKTKIQILAATASIVLATSVASSADVTENWVKNCASCHGKDGTGNTVMGKKSGVENYTDPKAQAKFTDADAVKIIQDGKGKMKAFKDKLTAEEIKALVGYIRSLKK